MTHNFFFAHSIQRYVTVLTSTLLADFVHFSLTTSIGAFRHSRSPHRISLRSVSRLTCVAPLSGICVILYYAAPFSASSSLASARLQNPLLTNELVRDVSRAPLLHSALRFFADKSLHIVVLLSYLILTSLVFVLLQLKIDSRICISLVEVRQINLIHSASQLKMMNIFIRSFWNCHTYEYVHTRPKYYVYQLFFGYDRRF